MAVVALKLADHNNFKKRTMLTFISIAANCGDGCIVGQEAVCHIVKTGIRDPLTQLNSLKVD